MPAAEAWKLGAWAQQLPNGSDADTRPVDRGFEVIVAIMRAVHGAWRATNEGSPNNPEVKITERPGAAMRMALHQGKHSR